MLAGLYWFLAIAGVGWWCYPVAVILSLIGISGMIGNRGGRSPLKSDPPEQTENLSCSEDLQLLNFEQPLYANPENEQVTVGAQMENIIHEALNTDPEIEIRERTESKPEPPEQTIEDFIAFERHGDVITVSLGVSLTGGLSLEWIGIDRRHKAGDIFLVEKDQPIFEIVKGSVFKKRYIFAVPCTGVLTPAFDWYNYSFCGFRTGGTRLFTLDCSEIAIEEYPGRLAAMTKAKKRLEIEQEKLVIANKLREKERRRNLEREVQQELIDAGEIMKSSGREPFPRELVQAVYTRDGGRCVYCNSTERLQIDHIIPYSRGGGNTLGNLQILCQKCNLEKSNKI